MCLWLTFKMKILLYLEIMKGRRKVLLKVDPVYATKAGWQSSLLANVFHGQQE